MEISVREAAANTMSPAPDVAVVPGAAASVNAVYPTQQWPRNYRDYRDLILLRLRRQWREGRRKVWRG